MQLINRIRGANCSTPEFQARKNVVVCGLFFFFVFSAFGPAQNLQTSLHAKTGFWALSLLYVTYAPSNLISPAITLAIGERKTLAIGAATYSLFVASNMLEAEWPLFITAALEGIGAALLWSAQGYYLTRNSTKHTLGTNGGLFQGINQMNQFVGNMVAGELVRANMSTSVVFLVLTIIGSVAYFAFFFLSAPPDLGEDQLGQMSARDEKPIKDRIFQVLTIFRETKFYFLAPMQVFQGITGAFYSGKFPAEVGLQYIGYTMAVFGTSFAIGCVLVGRSVDKFGRSPPLVLGLALLLIPLCCLTFIPPDFFKSHTYVYYILAGFFGLSNSCFLTVSGSTPGMVFSNRVESGQGALRLVSSLSVAATFFVAPFLGFETLLAAVGIMSVVGVSLMLACDLWIAKLDEIEPLEPLPPSLALVDDQIELLSDAEQQSDDSETSKAAT